MSIPNCHKYSKMSCRHVTFMLTIIIQQNHNFGLCTYCLPLCHNEQQKMGANVASFILGSKPGSFQCNATGLFTFPKTSGIVSLCHLYFCIEPLYYEKYSLADFNTLSEKSKVLQFVSNLPTALKIELRSLVKLGAK